MFVLGGQRSSKIALLHSQNLTKYGNCGDHLPNNKARSMELEFFLLCMGCGAWSRLRLVPGEPGTVQGCYPLVSTLYCSPVALTLSKWAVGGH